MSGKKTYTLLLNSGNAVNRTSTSLGIGAYQYYVNWVGMLPTEVKMFDLSYQFRSYTSETDPVSTVIVAVDFGTRTMYDQTGSSTPILGAIIPKSYGLGTAPKYYYESNNTDDCGCAGHRSRFTHW